MGHWGKAIPKENEEPFCPVKSVQPMLSIVKGQPYKVLSRSFVNSPPCCVGVLCKGVVDDPGPPEWTEAYTENGAPVNNYVLGRGG